MSKTFDGIIQEIELLRYDAEMNAISGRSIFLGALKNNPDLQVLITQSITSESHRQLIFDNLTNYATMETDPKWAHEKDVLLATYYYVLTQSNPDLALQAKSKLRELTNTFWTAYVVEHAEIIDPSIEDNAS